MSASRPDSYTTLKPWLTLPQLFSLTWLAYPILSLLFVAFRLQISSDQAQNAVEDAKGTLLTSCRAAEKAATSAASLPRFLAEGTNSQFVDAVNATINGARSALILALTCMQAIIEFVIDIYRSTFLCFLELIIRGSLSLLISASEEATQFVQNALQTIGNGLRDQVSSVNGAINSAVDAINKVGGIFGGGVNIPQVNINLDSLANIQIPNTIANGLTELNSTIPTMDELREAIDRVIGVPFDLVKKEINDTMLGITFDSSVLPVPQQNTVEFCSSLDVSVVDRLGADLIKITKIAIILIVIIAVLLILANCLFEWYKNKCLLDNFERTRDAWSTNPLVTQSNGSVPSVPLTDNNLRELHVFSSHPLFMWLCNKFTAFCRMRPGQVVYMRWFFCYVLHPPALACLLIGLLGLISVQLQLAAIAPLQAKYEGEVSNTVSDFTSVIGDHINESMRRDSQAYAAAVNTQMDGIQTTINDGLFGWVEGTTTVLNNTVVTFYTEVQNVVERVFGGTPLEAPVEGFVHCLIGTKVEAIENALTFLHDNLRVDLPRAKDDVLMISQQSMTEVAQPISLAAVGDQASGEADSGGLVGKLVLRYVEALKKERMMFFIFLGLWGFVVLMALLIMFWHAFIHPAIERRRKKKWHQEARDLGDSPWLATMADEKARPAAVTPPPALGFSLGREKERSLDDDKQSTSSSFNSASKLVAWYNKHRGSGDSADGGEDRPSLWARLKAIFCGRKANDDDDWSSNPPKIERSLPRPISPMKPAEDTASVSTTASIPRRKLPPPLAPIQAPVEAVRFPPPPQRVAPAPVPLHLSFAGQAPEEPTFRPLAPTPPKEQPARNSTTSLEAQRLRSVNPFTTPFDGHEESPFAHPADQPGDTPFTNQHMRRPQQPTPSYPAGRFI